MKMDAAFTSLKQLFCRADGNCKSFKAVSTHFLAQRTKSWASRRAAPAADCQTVNDIASVSETITTTSASPAPTTAATAAAATTPATEDTTELPAAVMVAMVAEATSKTPQRSLIARAGHKVAKHTKAGAHKLHKRSKAAISNVLTTCQKALFDLNAENSKTGVFQLWMHGVGVCPSTSDMSAAISDPPTPASAV